MDNLQALICKCCGGQIEKHNLTCKFCGTQYRQNYIGTLEIINTNRPIRFINNAVIIPREVIERDADKAIEYTLHRLAEKLAESLLPLSERVQEYRPHEDSYIFNMRIGVLEPKDQSGEEIWRR